jgi:hypothetical protein
MAVMTPKSDLRLYRQRPLYDDSERFINLGGEFFGAFNLMGSHFVV